MSQQKPEQAASEKDEIQAALALARESLAQKNREKEEVVAKLAFAVQQLAAAVKEREKRAAELDSLNKELAFQISEKEKKTQQLEAVNKELEAFTYSVSHDLRTPLRAIYGFSQVLLEEFITDLNEEAQELFSQIIQNSQRMGELIDNLLEFSRLNKQQITPVSVNIKDIITNIIEEHKVLEKHRQVEVVIRDLPIIYGDPRMLRQLFSNLISNAFKYTGKKENAHIEIGSFKDDEGKTVIFVKDNGAGFDERYYSKLFGVFQRLHSNYEFEGTGVGLAIVDKIISKHDGKVWAKGTVGEGACFYVTLPEEQK